MNYYRLPILIATCVTLSGVSPSYSQNRATIIIAEANSTNNTASNSYESYIQEGRQAIQSGLHQQALDRFQAALKLRPNDKYAAKALEEAKTSSFNEYMRQGYAASASKDYPTALKNFQQALKLKPEAFHAIEAVRNISQYIKIGDSSQKKNSAASNNVLKANSRPLWLAVGAFALFSFIITLLFFFQKKLSPSPSLAGDRNKQYNNPQIINAQSEVVTPLPTIIAAEAPPVEQEIVTPTTIDRPKEVVNSSQITTTTASVASLDREQSKAITKLDVVTELVKELEHPSPTKRRKAIWELAQRADSRAMKPLVELMIEADSQERSLILEAVSQIASRTLKPMNKALAISLEDPNSQVRKNAIRDLTRVYDLMTQVSQRLSYSLDDPDNEVRETAKWALKQLNHLPASVKLEDSGNEDDG
jgi:hypothetical protein